MIGSTLRVPILAAGLLSGAVSASAGTTCKDLSPGAPSNPSPWMVCPVTPWFAWYETLGLGARPLGMGGAWGAVADEAAGFYWNPAGTAQIVQNELTIFSGSMYVTNRWSGGPPNIGMASLFFPIHRPQLVFGLTYTRNLHTNPDNYFEQPETAPNPAFLVIPMVRPAYLQEDALVLTFAAPMSMAKGLNVGVNVKYYWADKLFVRRDKVPAVTGIRGYSADVGVQWRTALSQYGKSLGLGLSITDGAGQIHWGSGEQQNLPPNARASLAYQVQLLRQEITTAEIDLDQVADVTYSADTGRKLRMGFEQWFFDNQFAVRAGYVTPFGYRGFLTLGASLRWDNFQIDFSYRSGDEKTADHIPQSVFFQGTFRFGAKPVPAAPVVAARVDPRLITPRNEETATFSLKCEHEVPIERWALAIHDRNERLVRSFAKTGEPPQTVTWAGEDNRYQLLPDGEYMYSFKVRDMDGRTSITPPQRVYLTSPAGAPDRDPTRLFMMMDGFQDLSVKEQAALMALAKTQTGDLAKSQTTPTPGPGWIWSPNGPAPWGSPTAAASGSPAGTPTPRVAAFGSQRIPDKNLLDAYVATNPDNSRTLALDYITEAGSVATILGEIVEIARSLSGNAGSGVANLDVRAHYGDNVLRLNATSDSVQGLTAGRMSSDAWLSTSYVTVNGQQITPRR